MTANEIIHPLPLYPSTQARKSLSPSQLATINHAISSSLLQTAALPPIKRDTPTARAFIASYAKDAAFQLLQGLIWGLTPLSRDDEIIRKRTLLLAEMLAPSPSWLEVQNLLDLSIVYASTNVSRMKAVFLAALNSNPSLVDAVEADLVPAFTQLCSPSQGLHAIRKASHCITSFLHSSPPEMIRCFADNKPFILALASLYDQGLASIAASYGGISGLRSFESRQADEWELIWIQTKVSLIDVFHIIISALLTDLSSASGQSLGIKSERTFDMIFALLELHTSNNHTSAPSIPYLDQSLLTDYQQCYSLSQTLVSALRHATEKDPRLDHLESKLSSLDNSSAPGSSAGPRDPGILKVLMASSGTSPGIDPLGNGSRVHSTDSGSTGKGKGKASPSPFSEPPHIPDIEVKITQVLDIFPDHSPEHIRALLEYPPLSGNPERVIEVLLEGTGPSAEELQTLAQGNVGIGSNVDDDAMHYTGQRSNVFDDDVMDLTRLWVGKKKDNESVLRDRTFIEQMKADILRRVEEMSDEEEDDKGIDLAFESEEEGGGLGNLKICGDGEESGEEREDNGAKGAVAKPQDPEAILELAYIRDSKLFDRDATTRRSKERSDLKTQTGWGDEQIEGWRIMLERNPRKDKILAKHEFAGNQNLVELNNGSAPSGRGGRVNSGSIRGGRGGGRGGGRDKGGGPRNGEGPTSEKERAWKDRNKARNANHNRKKGHDKKMARGAGPQT